MVALAIMTQREIRRRARRGSCAWVRASCARPRRRRLTAPRPRR